ncbi:hypothetical protein GUJ93_ZPchr0005g14583 [Zizania palustris]|uniref:Uncharacterized protein n=1 Tax=Zizania palustris TaxID=103762 RepID=A0A8J5SLL5_ZIZPA|nr:hypothetical protein GUJ93_ZPchr0005g14583 [Zizania palustris]
MGRDCGLPNQNGEMWAAEMTRPTQSNGGENSREKIAAAGEWRCRANDVLPPSYICPPLPPAKRPAAAHAICGEFRAPVARRRSGLPWHSRRAYVASCELRWLSC